MSFMSFFRPPMYQIKKQRIALFPYWRFRYFYKGKEVFL